MLTVKAHIENNNYESVIVRIVTLHTGAVLETYEIQKKAIRRDVARSIRLDKLKIFKY